MLLLLSLACAPAVVLIPGQPPADTAQEELEVLSPAARPQGAVGGVMVVEWTAEVPGLSWVEYGFGDELELATSASWQDHDPHRIPVMGLKLGREVHYRGLTLTEDGALLTSPVQVMDVPPPHPDLVPSHLEVSSPRAHQGYVLTSQIHKGQTWVVILDADGDVVWTWLEKFETTIPMVRLHPDGRSLVYSRHAQDHTLDWGEVVEIALDGEGGARRTHTHNGHHAFVQLPDGKYGRISLRREELMIEDQLTLVSADRIIEVLSGSLDRQRYEVVFDFLEDYEREPGEEIFELPPMAGGADWTHANSLAFLEPPAGSDTWGQPSRCAGDYFLGARNLNAVFRINRCSGRIRWQLGGSGSDFDLSPDDAWHGGHFSEVWEGGLLMMDNGGTEDGSRVVEYAWDEEQGTVEAVWQYSHPEAGQVAFLGDARRLPSDHVLVSWTSLGTLEEVTREGEVLWRVQADLGGAWGRVLWVPELPGFQGTPPG